MDEGAEENPKGETDDLGETDEGTKRKGCFPFRKKKKKIKEVEDKGEGKKRSCWPFGKKKKKDKEEEESKDKLGESSQVADVSSEGKDNEKLKKEMVQAIDSGAEYEGSLKSPDDNVESVTVTVALELAKKTSSDKRKTSFHLENVYSQEKWVEKQHSVVDSDKVHSDMSPKASARSVVSPSSTATSAMSPTTSPRPAISPTTSPRPAISPTTSPRPAKSPTTSDKSPGSPTSTAEAAKSPVTSPRPATSPTTSPRSATSPTTSPRSAKSPTTSVKSPVSPTSTAKAAKSPATTPRAAKAPTISDKSVGSPTPKSVSLKSAAADRPLVKDSERKDTQSRTGATRQENKTPSIPPPSPHSATETPTTKVMTEDDTKQERPKTTIQKINETFDNCFKKQDNDGSVVPSEENEEFEKVEINEIKVKDEVPDEITIDYDDQMFQSTSEKQKKFGTANKEISFPKLYNPREDKSKPFVHRYSFNSYLPEERAVELVTSSEVADATKHHKDRRLKCLEGRSGCMCNFYILEERLGGRRGLRCLVQGNSDESLMHFMSLLEHSEPSIIFHSVLKHRPPPSSSQSFPHNEFITRKFVKPRRN